MSHHQHGRPSRAGQRRVLWGALVANALLMAAELVGGIVFDSLSLLADAAHMASDVAALGIALLAHGLMVRPASARHTYGLQRVEVLGALANALVLFAAAAWIVIEAVRRIDEPSDVHGAGVIVVAGIGLAVNLVSAVVIARHAGASLNMRAAFVHMAFDAVGSAGAVGAGAAIVLWDADWVDPAVSIGIAGLVLWSAWGLLRATIHVLLEGTPRGMDPTEVEGALASDADVQGIHHLHMWNIASDTPALSAHVVLGGEITLHEAQERGDRLKRMLAQRFGIEHATLELECHDCEAPLEQPAPASRTTD